MNADWRPRDEGPVTVVFGTAGYRNTIARWIEHARAAGCRHYRIVCLDCTLLDALRGAGEAERAIDFHELLPNVRREDFDAMAPAARLKALTPLRAQLFRRLAAAGCDFIHSDADAFWLRDPRPWLMRQYGYDLLLSQGTVFPPAHYRRHRFTVCAGFFLCRANERTRVYFERVDSLARTHPSDQVRMNAVLLEDSEGGWRLKRPVVAVRANGQWARPPFERWFGSCARYALARPVTRTLANLVGLLCRLDWMLTSRQVIEGRFGSLTAGVIPMHIVMRGRFAHLEEPLVMHSSENKVG